MNSAEKQQNGYNKT